MRRAICTLAVIILAVTPAHAQTRVKDLVRLEGEGESRLRGLGLVVGLAGTGDSGKELVVARPLAEVLRRAGNQIPDLEELKNARSVALVWVDCAIPRTGARREDRFDVMVSAVNSARSLRGGRLLLTPLAGPHPADPTVYALADGPIDIENDQSPTTGRVRAGAHMLTDIRTAVVGDAFTLILSPHVAGWTAATLIADAINQEYFGTTSPPPTPIARPLDNRSVRVVMPEPERSNPAAFVGLVLSTPINPALLRLPAQVICNRETGVIFATAEVEISPGVITHKDLTITTTVPAPAPSPQNPLVTRARWTALETGAAPAQNARLQDLLAALNQLDVPIEDQIAILSMLEKAGRLHAVVVIE